MDISKLKCTRGIQLSFEDNSIIEVKGKVGTRIWLLLKSNGSFCGKMRSRQRRNGSNCFLTANYVGFGITSGLGQLKNILNGTYKIPKPINDLNISSEKIIGFPSYGVIRNKKGKDIHAFIVLGKINNIHICFHQRGDKGRYEFTSLGEIINDWKRPGYYNFPVQNTHADKYCYIEI